MSGDFLTARSISSKATTSMVFFSSKACLNRLNTSSVGNPVIGTDFPKS